MDQISGKVARILNRRELVLNVGSDHGVRQGMKFAILNPKGARIIDPDTKEELGSVEVPKVIVEIVRVKEKLTVGRTFRSSRINVGGIGSATMGAIGRMFEPPKYEEISETLKTDERTYQQELDEKDSYVKIGDPAVQVVGEEYE